MAFLCVNMYSNLLFLPNSNGDRRRNALIDSACRAHNTRVVHWKRRIMKKRYNTGDFTNSFLDFVCWYMGGAATEEKRQVPISHCRKDNYFRRRFTMVRLVADLGFLVSPHGRRRGCCWRVSLGLIIWMKRLGFGTSSAYAASRNEST